MNTEVPSSVREGEAVLRGERGGEGAAMGFSPVDDERARAGFVVFQSLLRWTDVDLLTLWWVTRSASWLSRTGAGGVCLAVTVAARLLRRRA